MNTRPSTLEGYAAGLAFAIAFIPGVAAVVSIAAYLTVPAPNNDLAALAVPCFGLGILVAAVAWLALGAALRGSASADKAQPRVYAELVGRYDALLQRKEAAVRARDAKRARNEAGSFDECSGACEQVEDVLRVAAFELFGDGSRPAARWSLAYGYTNVLRELHRGEEFLLLMDTPEEVVGEALEDDLALEGSKIENRDRLRAILRAAVSGVSAAAAKAFLPSAAGSQVVVDALQPNDAREAIREVDHAVNNFRDRLREELIRHRNNLMWAMLSLALTAYLLIGLAFARGVPREQLAAASAFVLVGAVVGLFHRLNIDSGRDSAVEDYGLYQTRLLAAPVLSGLAAVAGVYLLAAAPGLTISSADQPSLSAVFSLTDTNHIGLVYAAIFGLTPGLLTGRLDRQTQRLEQDLATSAAASAA